MSADNLISFYAPGVRYKFGEKAPAGEITVARFVEMIRSEDCMRDVLQVRHAPTEEIKKKVKKRLLAVQLSVRVTSGFTAQAMEEGRAEHSGYLQLDIDGKGLNGKTPEEARALLGADPHVLAAFLSPSGKGTKGILRIKPCATEREHKAAFAAAAQYILDTYVMKLDTSTKDSGRMCFVSADAACTWNANPQELPVPELPAEVSRPAAKRAASTGKPRGTSKAFPAPPRGRDSHLAHGGRLALPPNGPHDRGRNHREAGVL